jgi:preprotein translocase subunit SecG
MVRRSFVANLSKCNGPWGSGQRLPDFTPTPILPFSRPAWTGGCFATGGSQTVGYEVNTFAHILNFVIIALGLLLILTILIQRGKGGGLIGAFGGAGGSSPFGSKAGDTFTRITLAMAGLWILLIMIQIKVTKGDTFENRRGAQQEMNKSS